MIYKSKIGKGLVLFMLIIMIFINYQLFISRAYFFMAFYFVVILFIFHLFSLVKYEIKDNQLIVRTGIFGKTIVDINSIKKVKETNNPLSSPALSLDRLEIRWNKYKWILISPKEKLEFINELKRINPNIEVILKKRKSIFDYF